MRYFVEIGEREIALELSEQDGKFNVLSNGDLMPVDIRSLGKGFVSLILDGRQYDFHISKNGGEDFVRSNLAKFRAVVRDEREKTLSSMVSAAAGQKTLPDLKAPMPGLIVKIEVEKGQEFKKGDGLIIIEAMKMENELKAVSAGKVKEIKVQPGNAVEKGALLITFE